MGAQYMNFVQVLKECESAGGAGSKLIIANALAKLDDDGRRLVAYALNPYLVFGIKKFNPPTVFAESNPTDITALYKLLDDLASRNLTGDAARNAWAAMLSNFTEETASYLERVVDKDVKAGFSDETFNKVVLACGLDGNFEENLKKVDKQVKAGGYDSFKSNVNYKYLVPVYACQLADKCESTEEFEQYVTFPCQADFKYDGCLSSAWIIELKDGRSVTIGEFVENKMEGEVLSYNCSSKKKEWKPVLAHLKNDRPDLKFEWFKITLEDGTVTPLVTGNHRFWLPELKCWRRVEDLQVGDILYSNKYHRTSNGENGGAVDVKKQRDTAQMGN